MTVHRFSRPVLLLVLALSAIFAPQAAKPVTAPGAAIVHAVSPAQSVPSQGGVERHTSSDPVLRVAPSAGGAASLSATTHDAHIPAPALLLVQRPRPPTQRPLNATVLAPTGRSPPTPAGT